MWPATAAFLGEDGQLSKEYDSTSLPPVAEMKKEEYIFWTTILWGFKILHNLLMYLLLFVIDLASYLFVILYSLVSFLLVLFDAPFGL